MDPSSPASRSRCPKTQDVYWLPRSACTIVPGSGRRRQGAICRASTTSSERMWSAIDQPTICRREDVEDGGAVDLPLAVGCSVMSVHHSRSGPVGDEPALHQVLVRRPGAAGAAGVCGGGRSRQPGVAHQPGDPLAAAPARPRPEPQLGVHPRRAVGAPRLAWISMIVSVSEASATSRAEGGGRPLVEARPRDPQDPAGHRDGDAVRGELLDQPEHYFGRHVLPREVGAGPLEDLDLHLLRPGSRGAAGPAPPARSLVSPPCGRRRCRPGHPAPQARTR